MNLNVDIEESSFPFNYSEFSGNFCSRCGKEMTVGEFECFDGCIDCIDPITYQLLESKNNE
jgi:hypothetical protein